MLINPYEVIVREPLPVTQYPSGKWSCCNMEHELPSSVSSRHALALKALSPHGEQSTSSKSPATLIVFGVAEKPFSHYINKNEGDN